MKKQKAPSGKFQLDELLRSAAARMRSDLSKQLVAHPGELGRDREEVVRAFLRRHLPKHYEVSTGFVFDADGQVSEQVDIVIADANVCPVFETVGGIRFFPCEAVVAVGQVKSSMTSETVMHAALANLESVKRLDRSAGGHAHDEFSLEPIDQLLNHQHQIFTFLLVTGKTLAEDTATLKLMDHVTARDASLWPNVILAPNKYLLTYCCDNGVCPNPLHARGVACKARDGEDDLVMRFYLLLAKAINVTAVARMPFHRYLQHMSSWNAKVFFAATDDPPPLLSQVIR